MPDVITILSNNTVITEVAGYDVALATLAAQNALVVSSAEEAAERSEQAYQDILEVASGAPDAPSVVNKLNRDGTNPDAGLLTNIGAISSSALALQSGAGLVGFSQPGAGSVLETLLSAVRRGGIFPEQKGAQGDGSTNDVTALTNAANSAAAANVPLILQPGKNYRINTGVTFPPDLEVIAWGATISAAANITMITLDNNTAVRGLKLLGPSATYNANSIGVAITGTVNGSGVAPTFKTNITLDSMVFENIGNRCVYPEYVDGMTVINPTATGFGYCFMIADGCKNVLGFGGMFSGGTGITGIGDLECIAVSWSCNDNDTDFVRYPDCENCVWYGGFARDFSWQPFDMHSGINCHFFNVSGENCRRGAWITARTGRGARNCSVIGADFVNTTAAFSTYADGNEKRGEAFFIGGDSDTSATTRAQGCYISGTCTGYGGLIGTTAAFKVQNTDQACGGDVRIINPYASGFALNGGSRGTYKAIIDNPQSPGTGGSTVNPRYIDVTAVGSDVVNVHVDATLVRSNPSLNTYVGVRAYSSASTLTNVSVNFTRFSYDDGIDLAVGSGLGTVKGEYPVPMILDVVGITGLTDAVFYGKRIGNDAIISLSSVLGGTSSSSSFTIGSTVPLPSYLRPSDTRRTLVKVMDNGTVSLGEAETSSAGAITIYRDLVGTGWTASGVKRLYDSTLRYSVV